MSQEDMSCYGAREHDHYGEWVKSNECDLQTEYLKKKDIVVLDDDLSDYFDCNNDEWQDYCEEQYAEADHEVYHND